MSDETTPQDGKAMPPVSAGSVTAGIRREIESHGKTRWGWDGDCGTNDIIGRIEDECDKVDAKFASRTLSNAERDAVEWFANMGLEPPHNGPVTRQYSAVLRGLLSRTWSGK